VGSVTFSGSHVYADDGTYTVKVCVKDKNFAVTCGQFTVTVTNAIPTLNAGGNQTVNEGATVNLAPATFNDKGTKDTHTATVNWGDNTATDAATVTETPTGPPGSTVGLNGTISASHVYADNGVYTVTVTVTDDDGGAKSDTFQVVVKNVAPTIDLISPNGGEIVHGIRQIRFNVSQLQGKGLTIEAFLGALPIPLIEGSAVTPPANGSVLEVGRTFDSTSSPTARATRCGSWPRSPATLRPRPWTTPRAPSSSTTPRRCSRSPLASWRRSSSRRTSPAPP